MAHLTLARIEHLVLMHTNRLPTDVQAEAVPLILGGGDVLMVRDAQLNKT